ncbi:MAG: hypothetical protein ABI342_04035 [Nitrososphaera sp.]|jgi:predicted DNA-binding protein (UPF0251 family)
MRKRNRKFNEPWKKDLDLLTPKKMIKYDDSIEALRLMRKGMSIRHATKEMGISIKTLQKYVGSALKIKKGKIIPKSTDSLLRKMRIYEQGKEIWIQVRGLRNSSIVGQYHSAVGKLIDKNERNALRVFKKIVITDDNGKKHRLETDRKALFEIFDKREEHDIFTIYKR